MPSPWKSQWNAAQKLKLAKIAARRRCPNHKIHKTTRAMCRGLAFEN